jgi:hypothetical protein
MRWRGVGVMGDVGGGGWGVGVVLATRLFTTRENSLAQVGLCHQGLIFKFNGRGKRSAAMKDWPANRLGPKIP